MLWLALQGVHTLFTLARRCFDVGHYSNFSPAKGEDVAWVLSCTPDRLPHTDLLPPRTNVKCRIHDLLPLRPLQRVHWVVSQIQSMSPKKRLVTFPMAQDRSPLFPHRDKSSSNIVVGAALPAD